MQDQFSPPQMDPEPEMGGAAAAEYGTPPPHLRQIPSPAPSETATDNGGAGLFSPSAIAQMMEMITQAMRGETREMMQGMNEKMDGIKNNTNELEKKMDGMSKNMDGMARAMREEMQCIGAGLQNGLDKIKEGQEQFKIGQGELLRLIQQQTQLQI